MDYIKANSVRNEITRKKELRVNPTWQISRTATAGLRAET